MCRSNGIRMGLIPALVATFVLTSGTVFADHPQILKVEISKPSPSGTRSVKVTVKHKDTGWEHYADNFEVLTPDGEMLHTRVLYHPHVDEQPFTRGANGVKIPAGLTEILVRSKDSKHGYGKTISVPVPKD